MLIEIRRFATLPPHTPENDRLDVVEGTTAGEAMHILNIRSAETLILVNGVHAGPDRILNDGDRLAFGSTSTTRSAPKNPYTFRGPEAAAACGRGPTTLNRWRSGTSCSIAGISARKPALRRSACPEAFAPYPSRPASTRNTPLPWNSSAWRKKGTMKRPPSS